MIDPADLVSWVLDNMQKLLFPEEWINLDQSMSKTELLSLFIVDRQGDITMTRLAESIGVPLSTTTGIVNRMVKDSYFLRVRDEADRRIVVLRLTQKGMSTIGKLKDMISGYFGRVQEILSQEEQATAMKIVMKLLESFQRNTAEPDVEKVGESARPISIE